MLNLDEAEQAIATVEPELPLAKVCDTLMKIDVMVRKALELKQQLEQRIIPWIQKNGAFDLGTMHYYVGNPPVTKCVDVPRTLTKLFEATNGDWDAVTVCLSTGAIKHGAASKVLPKADYDELFVTTRKLKLIPGVIQPRLQKFDTRFVNKFEPKEIRQEGTGL